MTQPVVLSKFSYTKYSFLECLRLQTYIFCAFSNIVLSMSQILDSFSARQAARLCGFSTVYMLDYLQRTGVFVPRNKKGKRKGKGRKYEFRDLLVLKAIKRLLDSGASVANLKKSLSQFQKSNWTADAATLENSDGIVKYLIVCADSVYLRKDADTLVDLSKRGQLTFSFIIDLDNLHSELRSDLGLPVIEQQEFEFQSAT